MVRDAPVTLPFHHHDDVPALAVRVKAHLLAGGLLAYPTETVYGLGSAPTDAAIERLAALKGRSASKLFLLLMSDTWRVKSAGLEIPPYAEALMDAFWPGPLTLILRDADHAFAPSLRGVRDGVAVRCPGHAALGHLIGALGFPLTSTSANLSGDAPARGMADLMRAFADPVRRGEVLVLDGGTLGNVPPSTLVDCTGLQPTVVREGAVTRDDFRRAGISVL